MLLISTFIDLLLLHEPQVWYFTAIRFLLAYTTRSKHLRILKMS